MPVRGYVLIFVFWALLAMITPTLVLWSAAASARNTFSTLSGSDQEAIMKGFGTTRRMMGSVKGILGRSLAPAPAPSPLPEVNETTSLLIDS